MDPQRPLSSPRRTAVFTIVSRNYWHYARTLMQSLEEHHPDWERFVTLTDAPFDDLDPSAERFETVPVSDLQIPDRKRFYFRYNILELNTAVKPWTFEHLFDRGYDRVVYLDPDVCVYSPLVDVEEALERSFLVLTPHLVDLLDVESHDGTRHPSELSVLRAGTYNLGFLAVSRNDQLKPFLHWWQRKLEHMCVVDIARGLFVDQKWMDLVPGLFEDVSILRDPAYNVAYWNVGQRPVSKASGEWNVAGSRLRFFHFSGIDPMRPALLSMHMSPTPSPARGELGELLAEYSRHLIDNGYRTFVDTPYALGAFADGTPIHDMCRTAYRKSPVLQRVCTRDPFASPEAFNQPHDGDEEFQPLLTPLMVELWEKRPDLQRNFPDYRGAQRIAYAQWFIERGHDEAGFDERFILSVRESLKRVPRASLKLAALAAVAHEMGLLLRPVIVAVLPAIASRAVGTYLRSKRMLPNPASKRRKPDDHAPIPSDHDAVRA